MINGSWTGSSVCVAVPVLRGGMRGGAGCRGPDELVDSPCISFDGPPNNTTGYGLVPHLTFSSDSPLRPEAEPEREGTCSYPTHHVRVSLAVCRGALCLFWCARALYTAVAEARLGSV